MRAEAVDAGLRRAVRGEVRALAVEPVGLPVRMIEPPPRASIARTACLTVRKVPVRLMSIVRCQTSRSRSAIFASWPKSCTPAFATTTSGAQPAASEIGEGGLDAASSEMSMVSARAASPIVERRGARALAVAVREDDAAPSRAKRSRRPARCPSRAGDERGLSLKPCSSDVPLALDLVEVQHRARFLSSSSSRKTFFQSSLMMLSRP